MEKQGNKKRLSEIVAILKKHRVLAGITPQTLPAILEDLGPTFIKIGQMISAQPNVLSAEYCKELEKLKTNVAPMAYDDVKAILEAEYGIALSEIFSEIERHPLGSASIGQVHRATLIDGTKVVVKVQRPGIYETLSR